MCIPLAAVAAIAMIGGGAVSAYSSIQGGIDAKKSANANAAAQRATALSVQNQGSQQAADAVMKAKRTAASGVAAAGAGGVDPNTGTPLTVAGQTAEFGELDSLRIINNASRTAWGYNAQAAIDEFQGKQAQTAGYFKAGSSLLSSAGGAYFGGVQAGLWGDSAGGAGATFNASKPDGEFT